jgi:hypothetical protein
VPKTAILADPTGIIYAPDNYAGKTLQVTGKLSSSDYLHSSPRGDDLKVPPPPELGMKLRDAVVLYVESIKVIGEDKMMR